MVYRSGQPQQLRWHIESERDQGGIPIPPPPCAPLPIRLFLESLKHAVSLPGFLPPFTIYHAHVVYVELFSPQRVLACLADS